MNLGENWSKWNPGFFRCSSPQRTIILEFLNPPVWRCRIYQFHSIFYFSSGTGHLSSVCCNNYMMWLSSVCCVYIGGLSGLVMRNVVLDSLVCILSCQNFIPLATFYWLVLTWFSMIVILWFEIFVLCLSGHDWHERLLR